MKLIFVLAFIQASIVLSQLTPGEFHAVNLTELNLNPQTISLANVKYYTAFTSIVPNATSTLPRQQIHQVFVENQANINSSFPIFIMPFGHMPGVSSLYSLFTDIGAFTFSGEYQSQATLQALPYGLSINQNTFANSAHLLFIDPIPGVGLSYWAETPPTNYTCTDQMVVDNLLRVLYSFQTQGNYPHNPYYIIGNGYASKIAALLAQQWKNNLNLTLSGLFLQNPAIQLDPFVATKINQEEVNQFQFLNDHNLIADVIASAFQACQSETTNAVCKWARQQFQQQIGQNLNFWNLFNYCFADGKTPEKFGLCLFNGGLYKLVNDQQFKNAFLAIFGNHTASENFQNIFNTQINYTVETTKTTFTILQSLITANKLKICIYNGDASAIMSTVDTKYYLNQMNLVLANNQPQQALLGVRYPQPIGLQLGGIYTQYNGLLYAQIKKGGFFAAKDKPESTLALVNFFLTGQKQQ